MRKRPCIEVERVEHQDPKAVVYRLSGRLLGSTECYEFLEDVRDAVRSGCPRVILNLEKVNRAASAGIGILAACYTSVTNADGRMCVVAVPKSLRTLMKLVCLWDLLEKCDTEADAFEKLKA